MSQTYYVVSTVRSVHTRLTRFQSPVRGRFKQYILDGSVRLVRGRPQPITDQQLLAFEDELREKVENGFIQIHRDTPDGPLYVFGEKAEKPTKKEKKAPEPAPEPEPTPEPEPEPDPEPEPEPEPEPAPEPEPELKEEEPEEEPPPPPPPPAKKKPAKRGRKKSKK